MVAQVRAESGHPYSYGMHPAAASMHRVGLRGNSTAQAAIQLLIYFDESESSKHGPGLRQRTDIGGACNCRFDTLVALSIMAAR